MGQTARGIVQLEKIKDLDDVVRQFDPVRPRTVAGLIVCHVPPINELCRSVEGGTVKPRDAGSSEHATDTGNDFVVSVIHAPKEGLGPADDAYLVELQSGNELGGSVPPSIIDPYVLTLGVAEVIELPKEDHHAPLVLQLVGRIPVGEGKLIRGVRGGVLGQALRNSLDEGAEITQPSASEGVRKH
jgi:hypothetical protein